MKKALILFLLIFLFTALIPLFVLTEKKQDNQSELVTLFSSDITASPTYNCPLQ